MLSNAYAEDYRKGAELARREGQFVLAEAWDKEADRLQSIEEYFRSIYDETVGFSPSTFGAVLYARLLKDGWTPPKGWFENG